MRILLVLAIVAAVTAGVLTHRKSEASTTASKPTAKAPNAQPAAPREISQHDWAKRSLDRAADVRRQVAQRQKEDGTR